MGLLLQYMKYYLVHLTLLLIILIILVLSYENVILSLIGEVLLSAFDATFKYND